jgi:iron complex transport system substrate-binding protein
MKIFNTHWLIIIGCIAVVLLNACTPAAPATQAQPSPTPTPAPIVITDGLGHQITLDKPAQRVASLAPSNTEILFAIGAGSQVVARDSFSDYPEQATPITNIGGGFGEIDTETLVSLQPDLVLAAEINPVEQVQTLEKLGLKVYYLNNPKDMEGMYENLRIVARLVGHEGEAETLIERLRTRVASVEEKVVKATEKPLVFYELDGTDPNAPWTSGPGTFIDLLLDKAGGTNLGNSLDSAWVQISVEALIAKNPDIILLGDFTYGGVKPEDVIARPGWDVINAVKNQRVYPFDDNLVSRPGPRMVDGLEALAKLLHPELFK